MVLRESTLGGDVETSFFTVIIKIKFKSPTKNKKFWRLNDR